LNYDDMLWGALQSSSIRSENCIELIVIALRVFTCLQRFSFSFKPVNPTCHLVDDMQNVKFFFCILSFKFNLLIIHGLYYNSNFLYFLCPATMMLNLKCSWLWRQNVKERDFALFPCSCRTQENVGIERVKSL